MKRYKSVEDYLTQAESFQEELFRLRDILVDTELDETVKWGAPCYMFNGKNIVGMGGFKSYFGLWFFQGALLEDKQKVLINAQEGVTKALRQWRMQTKSDIKSRTIKSYIKQAIEISKSGKEIKPDREKALTVPPELAKALSKNKPTQKKFQALTKGKQREYADYISNAKREETKLKRIEKILPMIREGVGLHDKYRNC